MNRAAIYEGLTKAAWAFVFLYLDINLGTLNLLPQWAGYLLLWKSIALLEGERRDLALLRPFCLGLGLWSLYCIFQFLTDLAALADAHQGPGLILGKNLRFCRSAAAVLTVLGVLPIPWDGHLIAVTVLVLVQLGVVLAILCYLFRLRKCFLEPPPAAG